MLRVQPILRPMYTLQSESAPPRLAPVRTALKVSSASVGAEGALVNSLISLHLTALDLMRASSERGDLTVVSLLLYVVAAQQLYTHSLSFTIRPERNECTLLKNNIP